MRIVGPIHGERVGEFLGQRGLQIVIHWTKHVNACCLCKLRAGLEPHAQIELVTRCVGDPSVLLGCLGLVEQLQGECEFAGDATGQAAIHKIEVAAVIILQCDDLKQHQRNQDYEQASAEERARQGAPDASFVGEGNAHQPGRSM